MIPPQFDYHAPGSLDEALALLGELDDAKVMSGGQSLLPMLKAAAGVAGQHRRHRPHSGP